MKSVVKNSKYWFALSGSLVVASLFIIFRFGLPFGIDFTGGSLLEISITEGELSNEAIASVFSEEGIATPTIQAFGENGKLIRFAAVDEEQHQSLVAALAQSASDSGSTINEERFESIGPSIGAELASQSLKALFGVLAAIALYVSWVFRKVSKPVASWKYGVITLVTLFHDVIIVVGFFALAGKLYGWQIDTSFIAALLTVLGYSVNDTIVVFDRIRENIRRASVTYEETIDMSIRQTFARSVNTSLTTLLALIAIYFFGGESVQAFSLALILGIIVGTYSSIFVASPLLALWYRLQNR